MVKPGSFVTELVPGDVRMVKIPVQEGQRLRYRAEAVDADRHSYDVWDRPLFNMNFYNPLREPVAVDELQRTQSVAVDSDKVLAGGMPSQTRVANRDIDTSTINNDVVAQHWLGGDQYIMLNLSRLTKAKQSEKSEPVRVQVTLEVEGQAGEGVKLVTSHDAPTNAPVNDQGKQAAGGSVGGSPVGLGRISLLIGAAIAGLVAIGAAIGATVLIRRRH